MKTIRVTHEHINKGVPGRCGCCPVALAINDVLLPRYHSHVTPNLIRLYNNTVYEDYNFVRPEVSEWITSFDRRLPVQPFQFQVSFPDKYFK